MDWAQPWLRHWRWVGEPVMQRLASGAPLHEALNAVGRESSRDCGAATTSLMRFVPQVDLSAGAGYEAFIAQTDTCPVRANLHDFFNGLSWLAFPAVKRRLNALHCEGLAQRGSGASRGALRDAATLLDENGAFLQAPDALWDALARKDWRALFGPLRPLWREARLVLFGHALLEKLAQPRKAITTHVLRVPHSGPSLAQLDDTVAAMLTADMLAAKPFAPLPVLGVPGWWPANEEAAFYSDASVFRANTRRNSVRTPDLA